jgi:hypothetical protein
MLNWSNFDRAALNEFLNSDLGQKFIRYLEQSRPKFNDALALDNINVLAISGAIAKGYEQALSEIERMRVIAKPGIPETKYIETHKN